MWKITYLILAVGVGILFMGYRRNNPAQRKLGLKIAIVGIALILVSNVFDLEIFPGL